MIGDNPLLDIVPLPRFGDIRAEHVKPAIDEVLDSARQQIADLEMIGESADWENFAARLQDISDVIDRTWAPISHLNAVMDSAEWRSAHDECLSKLTAFHTDVAQNEALYRGYRALAASEVYEQLDIARKRVVDNAVRDFRLGGVALAGAPRRRFKAVNERLSELGNRFGQNLLDATDAFAMNIVDDADVAGVPAFALALAREEADARGESGYTFTLKAPSYLPFLAHADSRDLRRRMYEAYVTRASDAGPDAGRFDNTPVMDEILALREEKARLLGFADYAELSLQTKMAASVDEVRDFLLDLAGRALPIARRELEELSVFARERDGLETLESWDVAYYAEKLKAERFRISEEALRPWFPLERVLEGLFAVVGRLFGVTVRAAADVQRWHDDVRFFEIVDEHGDLRGYFYLDLYARARKRGGAWMAECVNRRRREGKLRHPAAFLVCNFAPAAGGELSLLTHDEVITLFHEFGHGLHHLLTRVNETAVSGINGVAWDAVELPSQFLENWCWEGDALDLVSAHHETGQPLPAEQLDRLKAARNFHAGLKTLRQVEFSLFDLELHSAHRSVGARSVLSVLEEVRKRVAVMRPPAFNRFPNGFSHIFAGGYAAGYYSYQWAEVLAADAFERFREAGVLDAATGRSFLVNILEPGGTRDAMDLFVAFRGRKPDAAALLRRSGLAA